jgi:biopolymer transport protein ExbD
MKMRRKEQRKARIEIIPMIDTIFFLLVFFMLSSLSMTNLFTVPVTLPGAKGTPEINREVVMVAITKENKIFFNKNEVSSVKDIVNNLAKYDTDGKLLSVIINIDQSVEYRRFVELFDAIRHSGIPRISLAVNQTGS